MSDINFKTTFTPEEVEQKKQAFVEKKTTLVLYLKEITALIEEAGDNPLSGETRRTLMNKFSMVEHRLLDKFDVSSFEYFEAKEAVK